MPDLRSAVNRFLSELRRRRVFRVAAVYALLGWGVIEVVETVFPILLIPGWLVRAVTALVLIGFPVALVLAWAFDVTSAGIKRTEPASPEAAGTVLAAKNAAAFIGLGILVAVVGIGAYSYLGTDRPTAGPAEISSIAVLPFADMSPAKDQEYFSDGITEEILDALAQIPGLRVPARTSAFAFKGKNEDVREIAKRLNVQAVLEGSVRKAGERIRVTAQLIEAESGYHLWSDSYDRELTDIFAVQDEIARNVVTALRGRLSTSAPAVLVKEQTKNPEAHNEYLLGRYHLNRRNQHNLQLAIGYFEKAIALDPRFAQAYAGLAHGYALLATYHFLPVANAYGRAVDAARRALELDAENAAAYSALAYVDMHHEWRWVASEAAFRQAIRLNPGSETAHRWYALLHAAMGRLEASIAEAARAVELDPISPITHRGLGRHYYFRGEFDRALALQEKALEIAPDFFPALFLTAQIHIMTGEHNKALDALRAASDIEPGSPIVTGLLAYALGRAGRVEEARRHRAALQSGGSSEEGTSYWSAVASVGIGELESALDWLEVAHQERSSGMTFLTVEPLFRPLHDQPRFHRLLQTMGLPRPTAGP